MYSIVGNRVPLMKGPSVWVFVYWLHLRPFTLLSLHVFHPTLIPPLSSLSRTLTTLQATRFRGPQRLSSRLWICYSFLKDPHCLHDHVGSEFQGTPDLYIDFKLSCFVNNSTLHTISLYVTGDSHELWIWRGIVPLIPFTETPSMSVIRSLMFTLLEVLHYGTITSLFIKLDQFSRSLTVCFFNHKFNSGLPIHPKLFLFSFSSLPYISPSFSLILIRTSFHVHSWILSPILKC